MKNYVKNCSGLNRVLSVLLHAVIGLCVLCAQSCKTQCMDMTSEARSENLQDSTISEIRLRKPITVPESKVDLKIPMTSLLKLPPSASFSNRSGRANLKVDKDNDTIRIYASCDSLQMLVEYYQRELTRIRSQTNNQEQKVERRSVGVRTAFKFIFIGFVAGILATAILIKYRKK